MIRLSTYPMLFTVVLASFVTAGCDLVQSDQENVAVEVRTDQQAYSPSSTVVLRLSNEGETTLYRARCPVINLQELQDGSVQNEWMVSGFQLCGGRLPIEPNQAAERHLDLEGLQERLETARFDESVTYRLDLVDLYRDQESEDRLGGTHGHSNRFTITRP